MRDVPRRCNVAGSNRCLLVLLTGLLVSSTAATAQRANEDVRSGQLVFSASLGRNDEPWTLVLLDLQSETQQLLVDYDNGNYAVSPSWSPDGRYLLYSFNIHCDGVFIYDVEAGRNERIDSPGEYGGGCQAAWSPDGRSVAYMSTRGARAPGFYYDLYLFDRGSHTHRRLTTESGGYPRWSPDGRWIIYYAPGRNTRMYRIRPDGSGDELFPKLQDRQLRARSLSWSSDGKTLAFAASRSFATPVQVYTADSEGRDVRLLTPEEWFQATPLWSPRQDRIALLVNPTEAYGTASIRLVENRRSREVVAATYQESDVYNFWSPNGRAIAYAPLHGRTFEGRGVSVLNLDDGTVRRFATDLMAAYPVWRPVRR